MRHPLTLGVLSVTEVVLFAVGVSEDIITGEVHDDDGCSPHGAKFDLLEYEVASLQWVDERHPGEIADRKHESESVSRDVHGCQNCRLRIRLFNTRKEMESCIEYSPHCKAHRQHTNPGRELQAT